MDTVPWREVGQISLCSLMYATIPAWTTRYTMQIFAFVNALRGEVLSLKLEYCYDGQWMVVSSVGIISISYVTGTL